MVRVRDRNANGPAISLAGRYQSNPGVDHWTTVKNILKFLKRTKDMFLVYGGDKELVVNGYVDASFDTDPTILNRKPNTCLH